MRYIADFHLHSKYSRSTSPQLDLENINRWAQIKGVNIVNAPDFTHPIWLKEMQEKLEQCGNGFYRLKGVEKSIWFIPVTEVNCIFHQHNRLRKVHLLIFLPDWEAVHEFNRSLTAKGTNLTSDGRPILKSSAKEVLQIVENITPDALVVPAHAWTPWFSVFGSKSGFDSLEECFEELTPSIRAIETGLSSDPAMNRRLSQLDEITLISNSDAHSPWLIGREANVFDIAPDELGYQQIISIIKGENRSKFLYTIEFFPDEGKYHYDGHRKCGIRFSPEETKRHQGRCPTCRKPLTLGALNRIDRMSDRPAGYDNEKFIPYKSIVGLNKIIAESLGVKAQMGQKVMNEYNKIISGGGTEFNVLLDMNLRELENFTSPKIVDGIKRLREGNLIIEPGYDGVFGTVRIF